MGSGTEILHSCEESSAHGDWGILIGCADGKLDAWEATVGGGILLLILGAVGLAIWGLRRRRQELYEEYGDDE